jgi:hypothetical protein
VGLIDLAAVILVWYLLMAPTFHNQQTDSFMVDLSAPLSSWQMVSSYCSAADCEWATRSAASYPHIIAFYTLCVATDDPRFMER